MTDEQFKVLRRKDEQDRLLTRINLRETLEGFVGRIVEESAKGRATFGELAALPKVAEILKSLL